MIEAWWAWLRRWRPCVPAETYGGMTAEQWAGFCSERDVQIANLRRGIQDRDRTIDQQVLRIEKLEDNIRDLRELTKREGV